MRWSVSVGRRRGVRPTCFVSAVRGEMSEAEKEETRRWWREETEVEDFEAESG